MNNEFVFKTMREVEKMGAGHETTKLTKFWTVCEAWIVEHAPKKKPAREAINWFRMNSNPLKDCTDGFWKTTGEIRVIINGAKRLGIQVIAADGSKQFHDPADDPADVIELIYFMSNKIEHGEWQFDWSSSNMAEEKNLVTAGSRVIEKWVRWAYLNRIFL